MLANRLRRNRQDCSAFADLIASPVAGAVALPANAKIALRSTAGAVAGTTAATIVGPSTRTIKTPVLAAGRAVIVDRIERGTVVTAASGFDVLVHIGLGRYAKIAGVL